MSRYRAAFYETWVPRVGDRATNEMWRRQVMDFWRLGWGWLAPAVVGISFSYGRAWLYVGVPVAVGVCVAIYDMYWRRPKRISALMSEWLGAEVTRYPPLTPGLFDAWCRRQGIHPPPRNVVRATADERSGT